jgi:outer membrane lipoprotein-sorting protein
MMDLAALTHLLPGQEVRLGGNLRLKRFGRCIAVLALVGTAPFLVSVARGQAHPPTVGSIIEQLDNSAKSFHSLSANVERTKVTVVVNDHSTENGTLLVKGDKMLLEMAPPEQRTILRTGDNIYLYTPGTKQVEEYNLGKNRDLADEFLLLGFGTSGKELQKGFDIKLVGEEKAGDKKDVELELTPKSPGVKNQIAKVQIWLDETTWLPDEQQFTEAGSGDYSTVKYTKVVRNPGLSDNQFKQHWPKGTERVKPQG